MQQSPMSATPGAPAASQSPRTQPLHPIAASEYAVAAAWAPANSIEEHLVRKIASLGVTIENLLNNLTALDPSVPQQAAQLASFTLTATRLQKTQTTLESQLREAQAQRGIRATHPLTCEPLPKQADARPYVLEVQSAGATPVFKNPERITAPENMPDEARQMLETHFGTRIYKPSERQNGKFAITPEVIYEIVDRLSSARYNESDDLRSSASMCG